MTLAKWRSAAGRGVGSTVGFEGCQDDDILALLPTGCHVSYLRLGRASFAVALVSDVRLRRVGGEIYVWCRGSYGKTWPSVPGLGYVIQPVNNDSIIAMSVLPRLDSPYISSGTGAQ